MNFEFLFVFNFVSFFMFVRFSPRSQPWRLIQQTVLWRFPWWRGMWMADRCCNIIGKSGNFERKTPMEKPITAQTFEYPQKERFGAGGKLGPFGMGQMKFTRDQVKLPLCCLDQILETLYNFFCHTAVRSRGLMKFFLIASLVKRSFSCYVQVWC